MIKLWNFIKETVTFYKMWTFGKYLKFDKILKTKLLIWNHSTLASGKIIEITTLEWTIRILAFDPFAPNS